MKLPTSLDGWLSTWFLAMSMGGQIFHHYDFASWAILCAIFFAIMQLAKDIMEKLKDKS